MLYVLPRSGEVRVVLSRFFLVLFQRDTILVCYFPYKFLCSLCCFLERGIPFSEGNVYTVSLGQCGACMVVLGILR